MFDFVPRYPTGRREYSVLVEEQRNVVIIAISDGL